MTNTIVSNSKYRFGMDWLNGVLPIQDVHELFNILGTFSSKLRFERWEEVPTGKYNYKRRFCLDGKASIQLMYNPISDEEYFQACHNLENLPGYNNNSYVFFSISGDGIRYLNSIGGSQTALNKLLFYFYSKGFKATRFDPYCDILDKKNKIVPLIQKAWKYVGREQIGKPLIRTRIRRNHKNANVLLDENGNRQKGVSLKNTRQNFRSWYSVDDNGKRFYNCQLGHHGSTVGMFRCYNKLIEVQDGRLSDFSVDMLSRYNVKDYWYRLEYEMHKDNAAACFNALMAEANKNNKLLSFEDIFSSCFDKVFSIVQPTCISDLRGEGYAKPCSDWKDFRENQLSNTIHFVQSVLVPYIPCSLKKLRKNMKNLQSYVYAIFCCLASLPEGVRHAYLKEAYEAFHNKKRYLPLLDELRELPDYKEVVHFESFLKCVA